VHAALEEMHANGISPDLQTRALVEDVRREVGARTVWLEEIETGGGEVWTMCFSSPNPHSGLSVLSHEHEQSESLSG
jgi:hypothetical protein